MRHANFLLGLLWVVGACARPGPDTIEEVERSSHDIFEAEAEAASPLVLRDELEPPKGLSRSARSQKNRRDTYPINCHIHGWPSAEVASIKEAYSWFYQLWAPLGADAQQCRRIACFGTSGVWLCANSLDYKYPNSVTIADKMNELLDGDNGCLDEGNPSMVQGQVFTSDGWCVLVRGGEDCSVEPPEQGIIY
ncbi:hypothetical protein HD806DRAFT_385251 [Xylariaceae sp. AK1471]|nr:hypothetical protein HD806DRAFT_385251 [Xylariaceae sp. AK1471]